MKPSGDYSRYYCFDHETDFDNRKDALKHLVKQHDKTEEEAIAKLDQIDDMYDDMESFDDEIQ